MDTSISYSASVFIYIVFDDVDFRVSYVLCDPVLACVTVLPGLLFNHLPRLVDEYTCLTFPSLNASQACLRNHSASTTTTTPSSVHSFEDADGREIVTSEPLTALTESVRRSMLSEKVH